MLAAMVGHDEIVGVLLKAGADKDATDMVRIACAHRFLDLQLTMRCLNHSHLLCDYTRSHLVDEYIPCVLFELFSCLVLFAMTRETWRPVYACRHPVSIKRARKCGEIK